MNTCVEAERGVPNPRSNIPSLQPLDHSGEGQSLGDDAVLGRPEVLRNRRYRGCTSRALGRERGRPLPEGQPVMGVPAAARTGEGAPRIVALYSPTHDLGNRLRCSMVAARSARLWLPLLTWYQSTRHTFASHSHQWLPLWKAPGCLGAQQPSRSTSTAPDGSGVRKGGALSGDLGAGRSTVHGRRAQ